MTNIYAFDLSLRSTGVAYLQAGILSVRTLKTQGCDLQDAVRVQAKQAVTCFNAAPPDVVIIESGALGATRYQGYEELGALRWLVRDHVRHSFDFEVIEISPSHLKKVVTGNGRASKQDVRKKVTELGALRYWPDPKNFDEADAIGLVITYLMDNGLWRVHGQLQGAGVSGADGTADSVVPF
jgi:Holliday junction resolvasome RuvABC endonuclease subunit